MERMKMWPLAWACGTDKKTLLESHGREFRRWRHSSGWQTECSSGCWTLPIRQLQRWMVDFLPDDSMGTRGSYCMPWAGRKWGLVRWITDSLFLFSPSNTQKILFSWKAAIASFADLEMPAVLQHLEKEGQREEAELSCWVKEKGRKT